jgi:iron complex outermembrane receptor protein
MRKAIRGDGRSGLAASCILASRVLAASLLGLGAAAGASAQTVEDLSGLSIEELANITVTSISRRPEPLSQAAAAVYVITAEDIRRSGATSLPEALRLAPNLEVARLNAFNYEITARGFNSTETSNKLLVLVDGRSVYSPLAATVFWESVDVPLADVERIEVVSGPGGTLWGANAVNGVINVITRHSRDTQGFLVDAVGGNDERSGTVRYGGRFGEAGSYRVYASRFDRSRTDPVRPTDLADDSFEGTQVGFRLDLGSARDSYTLQGDIYRNDTPLLDTEYRGGNVLGRWTRQLDEGSSVQVQAYYDRKDRDYQLAQDSVETYDVQAQHNLTLGERHRIVWGGEYRMWRSTFVSAPFGFAEPEATLSVGSLFAQDEIALRPDLRLTLGSKFESNSYTGLDVLPNARLAWQVADDHLLWAAVSKAVRTPSRIDRELQAPVILAPAEDFQTEKLTAYELGYRGRPVPRASLSVSAFYNVYDDLRTTTPSRAPSPGNPIGLPFVLSNQMSGETYGVEAWGGYDLTEWWRLRAGFGWIHKDLDVAPGVTDIADPPASGNDPVFRGRLQSTMSLSPGVELDLSVRQVGRVTPSQVPAYTAVDGHLAWDVTPSVELSLHGLNLLDTRHIEVNDPGASPVRYIGRSVFLRLRAEY